MTEGWHGDDYWIFLSPAEAATYGVAEFIPGYRALALRSWDELVVADAGGSLYSAPCLPMIDTGLQPLPALPAQAALEAQQDLQGYIKWYVQPLLFGGSADSDDNTAWVDRAQHAQLVVWWNRKYRELVQARGRS